MAIDRVFIDTPVYKTNNSKEGEIIHNSSSKKVKVSILVEDKDYGEKNIELLKNILKAINFEWENEVRVRKFNLDEFINIASIKNSDNPQYILSFGLSAKKFDVQFRIKYDEWVKFKTFNLLLCPLLEDLRNDKKLKLKLWNLLQMEINGNK